MLREFRRVLAVLGVTILWAQISHGATYQWVDEKGVVNFTDDPDKIPPKYLKKARKITELSPSAPSGPSQQERGSEPPPPQPAPTLIGGKDEQAWRARFSSLRAEIKALREGLPAKEEELVQLRRKRVIFKGAPERVAYYAKKEEIEKDEARIKELEAELAALDQEASRAGVPLEWRK
ncbi:DUF4124 domain-containing protein [Geobacter sp.]|uniref:DUF4124 domain-containing protein n=1 Tax=Geobacter sp. TaxID=46610 RepID=UPI002617CBCF|nr:DUF4124 domain-containing protein [Geobacter sp.]